MALSVLHVPKSHQSGEVGEINLVVRHGPRSALRVEGVGGSGRRLEDL